ncbi:MAG: hypothetical protein IJO10_02230, partial [Clostridia bacterium]|nr:hypothetical protein [Clostridia bacterium]
MPFKTNHAYKKHSEMICTPKVRHFGRCIFLMSKKGQKYNRYSAEFKTAVILDMREHHMGYR